MPFVFALYQVEPMGFDKFCCSALLCIANTQEQTCSNHNCKTTLPHTIHQADSTQIKNVKTENCFSHRERARVAE